MIGFVQQDAEQLQAELPLAELLQAAAFEEARVEGRFGKRESLPGFDAPGVAFK